MSDKLLSVVIPCYNCEDTIIECVSSVISECKSNNIEYEIILIDDGSCDGTLKLCENIAHTNENIIVISQKNEGPSSARNHGVNIAKGKYIAFNDSDDRWVEGKLHEQLNFLILHPEIYLVCSNYGQKNKCSNHQITLQREMFHNYFSTQTSIIRKEVFDSVRFPIDQKYSEDMKFFINVVLIFKCFFLNICSTVSITNKRSFGDSGLSSKLWEMEKGELKNIKYVRKIKRISFLIYFTATLWSIVKFIRRCFISLCCKLIKNIQNKRKL